jgi:hypothetical protein
MSIRIEGFEAITAPNLAAKIDEFINREGVELLDIEYSLCNALHGALVVFRTLDRGKGEMRLCCK